MLTLSGITKAYAGRTLFQDVTLQINRKDRLGLVGPNGAGKTTLFSIILGTEISDEGTLILERNAVLGHLPQESAPVGNETVLEVVTDTRPLPAAGGMSSSSSQPDSGHPSHPDLEADAHLVEARAKQVLTGLAFRQEDFNRPAREMSGGWVMRAHLARLLVRRP
ncbi:MAG TPA: ATP-binding cassette domain-containing protein, partial [Methylomirabilota bacterium]|nr:ATP-binding cassette domain-containing protein [Methylomirabilota bacterium]